MDEAPRPPLTLDVTQNKDENSCTQEREENDKFDDDNVSPSLSNPARHRLRTPSFEGYFMGMTGSVAVQYNNMSSMSAAEKIEEIQSHLEQMISLFREVDALKMAIRIESKELEKKRYLTVIASNLDHSAIIGIDWTLEGPTIGMVIPICSTTIVKCDGDGGFHVSRGLGISHIFKPISIQSLWSALQVIQRAYERAKKKDYYYGIETSGFLEHYNQLISSEQESINTWNELDDTDTFISIVPISKLQNNQTHDFEADLRHRIRGIMMKVELDEISCYDIRIALEAELQTSLVAYKQFIDKEIMTIMGQLEAASQIFDYLYLGSEWNASDVVALKELGVGSILNVTRESDNFYPSTFTYYNVRVHDEEEAELLPHWDHTYRFIEQTREAGKKILVHCRMGISRSGATVIAYVMKKKRMPLAEAMQYVVSKRAIVNPNPGFIEQLIIYEGILNSSRNRFSTVFHQMSIMEQQRHENQSQELNKDENQSEKKRSIGRRDVNAHRITFRKDRPSEISASFDKGDESLKEDLKETEHEVVNAEKDVIVESPMRESLQDSPVSESPMKHIKQRLQHQQTFTSSSKGRMMLARTMTSGAVFMDEDDDTLPNDEFNENPLALQENLEDAQEAAILEQVLTASQMKRQLVQRVNTLLDPTVLTGTDEEQNESVRPSEVRRMSSKSSSI